MISTRRQRWRVRKEFNRIGERYARVVGKPGQVPEDLSWLPLSGRSNVLDVACGPGTYSIPLSERAGRVVSLDLAESMLRFAQKQKRRLPPNPVFLQGDAYQLPFSSGEFDLCFCAFSLAHFQNPRQVMQEMARVIRPEGFLAILDVIAPPEHKPRRLLNRLESSRESCYTRIREGRELVEMFSDLPLRWMSCRLEDRAVSFRRWIAASHLQPGSAAYRRSRQFFSEAAAEQARGGRAVFGSSRCRYRYTVARFLLRKIAGGMPGDLCRPAGFPDEESRRF